jgi:hypothetical protein
MALYRELNQWTWLFVTAGPYNCESFLRDTTAVEGVLIKQSEERICPDARERVRPLGQAQLKCRYTSSGYLK